MSWECTKVENLRLKFIQEVMDGNDSMTQICKKYRISRKTAYKWLKRFKLHGEVGLTDLPKTPHKPYSLYPDAQIELALDYKLRKRRYGPKKVLVKMREKYPQLEWPSRTRMHQIFKQNNLVTPKRIRSRVPATAPLGDLTECNATWAMDFKGWFMTRDGEKCEPLTITDCYTRFLIRCVYLKQHTVDYVWPIFEEAFLEYGLPNRMRSDNGPPFGSVGAGRLTRLSVNFIKAGVLPEWIRPGHPEDNSTHERMHLTLKEAVATPPKETLSLQIKAMKEFKEDYNFERPHEALDMKTPGSCYRSSPRTWDGVLRSPEYDEKEMQVRKVCPSGCIWVKQNEHYVGQVLAGEYVGIKTTQEGEKEMYYGPVYLGKFSDKKGLEKPKIKTRRQR